MRGYVRTRPSRLPHTSNTFLSFALCRKIKIKPLLSSIAKIPRIIKRKIRQKSKDKKKLLLYNRGLKRPTIIIMFYDTTFISSILIGFSLYKSRGRPERRGFPSRGEHSHPKHAKSNCSQNKNLSGVNQTLFFCPGRQ